MLHNKKGVALLQVLMITAVLGGLCAMVLRISLDRTVASRKTRHTIAAQMAIESCMAEVNNIWALKNPTQYANDIQNCQYIVPGGTWDGSSVTACDDGSPKSNEWYCRVTPALEYSSGTGNAVSGTQYCVTATIAPGSASSVSPCQITYAISDGVNL